MKVCKICGQGKDPSEFGKSSQNKDGLDTNCRPCRRERVRAYRATEVGRASAQATVRRYHQSAKGRLAKRRYEETENGRAKRRVHAHEHKMRHPDKKDARDAVSFALRKGLLKREPCWKCREPDVHGHHEDYSRPLDVVWLCKRHHIERHASMHLSLPDFLGDCL